MFQNTSEKIKRTAKVLFVIAIISAAVLALAGLVTVAEGYDNYHSGYDLILTGWIYISVAVGLVPISYIICLFIYGFGELVENSRAFKNQTETAASRAESNKPKVLSNKSEHLERDKANDLDAILAWGLITQEEYKKEKNKSLK